MPVHSSSEALPYIPMRDDNLRPDIDTHPGEAGKNYSVIEKEALA
jgi:hypothetical protein